MMAAAAPATGATSRNAMHVKNSTLAFGARPAAPHCPQVALSASIATVSSEAVAKACRRSHWRLVSLVSSLIDNKLIGKHEYVQLDQVDSNNKFGSYHLTESGVVKVISFVCRRKTPTEQLRIVRRLFQAAIWRSSLEGLERTSIWQKNRTAGKAARKALSEVVHEFVEYATTQGSKNAKRYHGNITEAVYKALFPTRNRKEYKRLRDRLNDRELALLATAESIVECALVWGMTQELHYKAIFVELNQRLQTFACLLPEIELADCSVQLPTTEAA